MKNKSLIQIALLSILIGFLVSIGLNYGVIPPSGKYGKFHFDQLNISGFFIMNLLTSVIIFVGIILEKYARNSKINIICPKCEHSEGNCSVRC